MKAEVEFQKKFCQEVETVEQKRPADIFQELLDYLWNGLDLEEKGWKRLKKGDFKKKMKNGLTYQIWFDRSRYNYIDYEIGHGNVEVGFSCIIKQGDDYLYSFRIEPTTGGSFFRMLTEDLRLNTGLLDTFLPLVKANYLDFIDRFEADPVEALQPVCAPFTEAEDYSWRIHVDKQMVERYGTAEQLEEYRRQVELRGTPECKAKTHTGKLLFYQSHAKDVDHAWASSRTKEELDQVVDLLCRPSGRQDSGRRRMRRAISSTSRKQIQRNAPFEYGILLPTPGACRKSLSRKNWNSGGSCSQRRRRKANEQ